MSIINREQTLIQEVLTGNKKSEEELYTLYKTKIKNFVLKKSYSNGDVDDDVSEIMIKIFSNLESYDSEKSKFSTWAFTIATNYLINKSKKKQPEITSYNIVTPSVNYVTTSCDTIATYATVADSYTNSPDFNLEINDSLNHVSNQIGLDNFSMISMKYMYGFKYKEIGDEFNMSESTVSNKINYCINKFNDLES